MLFAKLFATLAVLQIGLFFFESRKPTGFIDVYFHATYLVLAPAHLVVLMAISSACFALVYVAASRWIRRPLSNSLGLAHVALTVVGFVLLSVVLFSLSGSVLRHQPLGSAGHWLIIGADLGVLCFLLGCAMLAANCLWTAIVSFRAH